MVHATGDGLVFRNGVRQQDEIVVVNMRMLCGICDAAVDAQWRDGRELRRLR